MSKYSNKYGKSFNCSVKDYNKLRTFCAMPFYMAATPKMIL